MNLDSRCGLALLAVLTVTGCDQRDASTPKLGPSNAEAEAASLDLRSHSGQSYEAFSASMGMQRFALSRLDLSHDERERVAKAMARPNPSHIVTGGGTQALVFTGCAREGCEAGEAVLAFGDHGETFVGIREEGRTEELLPDDRMEALLRLTSPTRRWDDPGLPQPAPQPASQP